MPSSFASQAGPVPDREYSPEAPPYSPITPEEATFPSFANPVAHPPEFMDTAPPSEPINETTNSDAIALRAALGILQIQRQRALQDMQTLEKQKTKALEDPEAFSKAIADGSIRSRVPHQTLNTSADAGESDSSDAMNEDESSQRDESGFGEIPDAQSVARCPPINWSKYHVVGEVLDKMHEEQQSRPAGGQEASERAPVHHITAPYNPLKDKLSEKADRAKIDVTRKAPP